MAKENIKAKEGFTIIEVVLVLAIAGLIFLMVFIALPALQRSQRDTQRRDDMARFISQLAQYQTNNNRRVPGSATANALTDWQKTLTNGKYTDGFIGNYLNAGGDTFDDPNGSPYQVGSVCVLSNDTTCNTTGSTSGAKKPNQALTWDADKNKIYVYKNAKCDGENAKFVKDSPNQIAIRYKLEGAGVYCGNN